MSSSGRTTQKILVGAMAVVAVVAIAADAYGASTNPTSIVAESAQVIDPVTAPDAAPVLATASTLDESDADGIGFMREEEKLARDVYLTLADMWDLRIFANIAEAEQTHMDAVLGLIDTYAPQDPVGNNEIGVFVDPSLQQMYDDPVASESESVESALKVGALIEEVDIEDLVIYLDAEVPTDAAAVYQRLLSGSENHLRAFVSQIESAGAVYEPTVLDTDAYKSILASEDQRGGHEKNTGSGHGRNA
jgi:hypothetical protein